MYTATSAATNIHAFSAATTAVITTAISTATTATIVLLLISFTALIIDANAATSTAATSAATFTVAYHNCLLVIIHTHTYIWPIFNIIYVFIDSWNISTSLYLHTFSDGIITFQEYVHLWLDKENIYSRLLSWKLSMLTTAKSRLGFSVKLSGKSIFGEEMKENCLLDQYQQLPSNIFEIILNS